ASRHARRGARRHGRRVRVARRPGGRRRAPPGGGPRQARRQRGHDPPPSACDALAAQGADAARSGLGPLDMPFVIDEYTALPPSILRFNPSYYHVLLKDAGFETERGFVDYRIALRTALVSRWERAVTAAERAGFRLVPLREITAGQRAGLTAA